MNLKQRTACDNGHGSRQNWSKVSVRTVVIYVLILVIMDIKLLNVMPIDAKGYLKQSKKVQKNMVTNQNYKTYQNSDQHPKIMFEP